MSGKYIVTNSPQFHSSDSTSKIMWTVTLTLLPAALWGVYAFGLEALWTLLISVSSAVLFEAWVSYLLKKNTLWDGSAFLTGLLIGMNMPALPLPHVFYIPVAASFFAIVIVKGAFGGLGNNWMNPALAGRVFVFFSWTKYMNQWKVPFLTDEKAAMLTSATPSGDGIDMITGATPLGAIKAGLLGWEGSASGSLEFLSQIGEPVSYMDLFLGKVGGSIGEISAVLLLAGALWLFIKKYIRWETIVSYLGVFVLFIWIFEGRRFGNGFFTGDVLFHLLSGGFILGCFFMATDMVTSPLTGKGLLIFGAGCGLLTFLFRVYGANPEGVSLAIIIMNITVPVIDRYTGPERFGVAKKGRA